MKNLLFIFLLFTLKAASQTAFPVYFPGSSNTDSIKQVVNVNGSPRQVYNIDLIRYRAALTARDTAAALRLLIASNTTSISLKADKANTISINGSAQTLGSNPSFTISGGGSSTSVVYDITAAPFNAVGDGVTDNTNAINAAITAASTSKGVVWMPPGTYGIRVSYRDTATVYKPSGINMADGVTLMGAGIGKTTIKALPSPADITYNNTSFATNAKWFSILKLTNISNTTLKGFSINGNIANQINYNSDAYTNRAEIDTIAQQQTSGVVIIGGKNNSIYSVKIDSIPSYAVANFSSTGNIYDNLQVNYAINGGVFFSRTADGSILKNSIVTNCYSDNVRIKSNNITVINSELSWTKFNVSPTNYNYAGVYIEGNAASSPAPIGLVGIKIINNYIHDNSSFGIDISDASDTTVYTRKGTSVLISNNRISFNSNSGITSATPNVKIENNDISNNAGNTNSVKDPVVYGGFGVYLKGSSTFGTSITGNTFKDTRGLQLQGVGGVFPSFIVISNNTQVGGTAVTGSLVTYSGSGNYLYDASGAIQSDISFGSGALYVKPAGNSVAMFNSSSTSDSYLTMSYRNGGQLGLVGYQNTTAHMGMYFDNKGTFGGTASTSSGREIRMYDQVSGKDVVGINSSGDVVFGINSSQFGGKIRPYGADLSSVSHQADFSGTSSGTTASSIQSAVHAQIKAGYTGAGYPIAVYAQNAVAGTGNLISGDGSAKGNFGLYAESNGTSATGANIGGYLYSTGALRNVGIVGNAAFNQTNSATALSLGIVGYAKRTNASAVQIAGYFGLQTAQPTFESAALIADNGAETSPIFLGRVNGVTKFTVDASGNAIAPKYQLSALNTAPSSATDVGTTGEIRITSGFIYVCVATNTWVRSALATW